MRDCSLPSPTPEVVVGRTTAVTPHTAGRDLSQIIGPTPRSERMRWLEWKALL